MAKKRTTLPKDFEDLLKQGDIAALKAVFTKCELDARGGYGKQTALAYDKCPHELAKWLIEQGADIQAKDTWGNTPLHERARSIFGNIASLLELGADVNDNGSSVGTPLHAAADSHNPENTKLLIAQGAKVDELNKSGLIPLEQALRTCRNIDIVRTLAIAKIYLDAGILVTARMKEFVAEIGKQFEFHRAKFAKDSVVEVSIALSELYRLFQVDAVPGRIMHDGIAAITSNAPTWQEKHQDLWEQLVPSSGSADTIQGEVIRIGGRIANELDGNGGGNWDSDFKKMADTFLLFISQGNPLPPTELAETTSLIKEIKQKSGDPAKLCELGVKWVMENPKPVKCPPLDYKR